MGLSAGVAFVAPKAPPQAPIFCRLNLCCQFLHSLALNPYQNFKWNLQIILFFFIFFPTVECEIFSIAAILSAKICSYRGVYALVPLVGWWEKKSEGAGRVSVLCHSKEQEKICTHCDAAQEWRLDTRKNLLRARNAGLQSLSAWVHSSLPGGQLPACLGWKSRDEQDSEPLPSWNTQCRSGERSKRIIPC